MADNLKKHGPADAGRISLSEDWEVKYWTKALACSVKQLTEAVKKVGNQAAAVRSFLAKPQS